eukprot:PhF_6_TR11756/c1_g1_i1/m.19249
MSQRKETEEERRARKERERQAAAAQGQRVETEEERRIRKERERAEKAAAAAAQGQRVETEEERRIRKERERAEKMAAQGSGAGQPAPPGQRQETEDERRIRKERERAEKLAAQAAGGQRVETEEERRARKEREREAAMAAGQRVETEEERRARKERERAEKVAAAAAQGQRVETEEERRIRKERERAEKAAAAAAAGGAVPGQRVETEEERRARKERERAEGKGSAPPPPPPPAVPAPVADPPKPAKQAPVQPLNVDKVRVQGPSIGTASPQQQGGGSTKKVAPSGSKPKQQQQQQQQIDQDDEEGGGGGDDNYDDDFEDEATEAEKSHLADLKAAMDRENAAARIQSTAVTRAAVSSTGTADLADYDAVTNIERKGLRADDVRKGRLKAKKEKERQRADQLKRVVELDFTTVSVADFAPLTEYDMLMRSVGDQNKNQASIQAPPDTDMTTSETQTDKINYKNRECQAPHDGITSTSDSSDKPTKPIAINFQGLRVFMGRVFPVVRTLLDENAQRFAAKRRAKTSEHKFSSTYSVVQHEMFAGRQVLNVLFSKTTSFHFMTVLGPVMNGQAGKLPAYQGIIVVWNTNDWSSPDAILLSCGALTTACFGSSKPFLVIAGTKEGTLQMWDLRESDSVHCTQPLIGTLRPRLPTYSTNWLLGENHASSVRRVLVVGYNSTIGAPSRGDDVTEQIASLDETGTVSFWIIVDNSDRKDTSVSETDYGLNMFSKVKLFKSATFAMRDSLLVKERTVDLSTFDLEFEPEDPGLFNVCTEGAVLHHSRFKLNAVPAVYRCTEISTFLDEHSSAITRSGPQSSAAGLAARTIQYCPTDSRLFLVGMSDGTIFLFRNDSSMPRLSWCDFTSQPIAQVRWSNSTKGVFYVLDTIGTFGVFDMMQDDTDRRMVPLVKVLMEKCTSMALSYEGEGSTSHIAFGFSDGRTEMHELSDRVYQSGGARGGKFLMQI